MVGTILLLLITPHPCLIVTPPRLTHTTHHAHTVHVYHAHTVHVHVYHAHPVHVYLAQPDIHLHCDVDEVLLKVGTVPYLVVVVGEEHQRVV